MVDPLSIAAGISGLLVFAKSSLTKGYAIVGSSQGAATEISRLLGELSHLTGVLAALEAQEDKLKSFEFGAGNENFSEILGSSIGACQELLKEITTILDGLEKDGKVTLAIEYTTYIEPRIQELLREVGRHRNTCELCLGIDIRYFVPVIFELNC